MSIFNQLPRQNSFRYIYTLSYVLVHYTRTNKLQNPFTYLSFKKIADDLHRFFVFEFFSVFFFFVFFLTQQRLFCPLISSNLFAVSVDRHSVLSKKIFTLTVHVGVSRAELAAGDFVSYLAYCVLLPLA